MDTLDAIAGEHRPIDHETREAVLAALNSPLTNGTVR